MADDDDFFGDSNQAGQALLKLVARANANIAELMRLSDYIPSVFFLDGPQRERFMDIIVDFRYFEKTELIEHKISSSEELSEMDEAFSNDYIEILERFYRLFDSIYRYVQDFLSFLDDLKTGIFIQHTVESMLFDTDGKQLMSEAIYLYGVTLMLMDVKIEGVVRERMLVSYYRAKGQNEDTNIDEVCKLCKQTGFSVERAKVPANYPEAYFARFPLPKEILEMVIGRLRTDDIYKQMQKYPNPNHRSTALATQARMLYIILYFTPHILHKEASIMREIVDKHFPDNWVIAYYMGFTADLSVAWAPYKAACKGLGNTMAQGNIKETAAAMSSRIEPLNRKLNELLTEGVLTEEYVLDHIPSMLETIRECNVTLRWLMLHRMTTDAKLNRVVTAGLNPEQLLFMLMCTAEFEYKLKEILKKLLADRTSRWDGCRKDTSERMMELSEYFTGDKPLTRVTKNADLQNWFKSISEKIAALDIEDSVAAGRKMQQLINALEEVEQYHQIDSSLQIKQFLAEARGTLTQMIRIVNVKDEELVTMDLISDFSYAWEIINDFTKAMQDRIELTPHTVLTLRATFLKLASVLELPIMRISQANSEDLESVAQYYSSELVAYIRKVLQIIPISMFGILDEIASLQTSHLRDLPTKVEIDTLKDMAQLQERHELAKSTHRISVFTEGILAMDATMLGIIKVEPRELLEDGIRRELVKKISSALQQLLHFDSDARGGPGDWERRLTHLQLRLDGYRTSFEYIQDYVNLHGLKIWQEEFCRIVNFNIEQECNRFLKQQVFHKTSAHQDKDIPIPYYPPSSPEANTFMGRIVNELLRVTDPRRTMYLAPMNAWFDGSGNEVLGIRHMATLHRSVSTFGVIGIDRLLCFRIVSHLTGWDKAYRRSIQNQGKVKELLAAAVRQMKEGETASKNLLAAINHRMWTEPVTRGSPSVLDIVMKVGHAQLLRRHIANELNFSCQLDSNVLFCALTTANKSAIEDVRAHYVRPAEKPLPDEDNPFLADLSKYLEASGVNHPFTKIYITTEAVDAFPTVMFFFVLSQAQKFFYEPNLASLQCEPKVLRVDPAPFVVGVVTLLTQFHSNYVQQFIGLCGEYVRFIYVAAKDAKNTSSLPSFRSVMLFLEDLCRVGHFSRKLVEEHVPHYIFDSFRHM